MCTVCYSTYLELDSMALQFFPDANCRLIQFAHSVLIYQSRMLQIQRNLSYQETGLGFSTILSDTITLMVVLTVSVYN